MEGKLETKDGLRELIEMRNNKRNLSRNLANRNDDNNTDQRTAYETRPQSLTSSANKRTLGDDPADASHEERNITQAAAANTGQSVQDQTAHEQDQDELEDTAEGVSANGDQLEGAQRNGAAQQQQSLNQGSIPEGRRTLRKNMGSTRGSYWSTMRALSSEDTTKRFGPFSTGSNSASNSAADDLGEGNGDDASQGEDDRNSNPDWADHDVNGNDQNSEAVSNGVAKPKDFLKNQSAGHVPMDQSTDDDVQAHRQTKGTENDEFGDEMIPNDPLNDDAFDEQAYDAQELSDNNLVPPDDVPVNNDDNLSENLDAKSELANDPNIWTLPADRNECTLEEIRRGQVINKVAGNECPVLGCGKKINEMRAEPSPGTIASGLRTHVLFVHYANRKSTKKRKLGWSNKRRQVSPRKPTGLASTGSSPSTSKLDFDMDLSSGSALNLMQKSMPSSRPPQASTPSSVLSKKLKQISSNQVPTMSSLQSLIQATGGAKLSPHAKQKVQEPSSSQKNFNQTTSSLFSILAGLTQQQQMNQTPQQQQQQQPPPSQAAISRNIKTAQGTNTINISQCSRTPVNNNSARPVNSSLLSLLNEKISGNVASSLQKQLKKSLGPDMRSKVAAATPRQNLSSSINSSPYYQQSANETNFNASQSILNSLCSGNGDNRASYDNSMSLDSFIESIALRTGSNIGPPAVSEAKKIIEKFTASLICSAQTIADHYIAPYGGDMPQQKPEISQSDLLLAYKMMNKSHGQP